MELTPVQATAGVGQSSSSEEVVGASKPTVVGLKENWPLVASAVEQLRRTKDTVRAGAVSRLRQALVENGLRVDSDLIATLLLDEIMPV